LRCRSEASGELLSFAGAWCWADALSAIPDMIEVPPFSVNIYAYPLQ